MRRSRTVSAVLLVLSLVMGLSGCGGDGPNGTTEAERSVSDLVNLNTSARKGQISNDEFIMRLYNVLRRIDSIPDGPESLTVYLEQEVWGQRASRGLDRAVSIVPFSEMTPGEICSQRTITEDFKKALEYIRKSPAFQRIKIFLETVALFLVPAPASQFIQLAKPEVFVTFYQVAIRRQILDAYHGYGNIDYETMVLLLEINSRNPAEAQRQLLAKLNKPIPDWLATVAPGLEEVDLFPEPEPPPGPPLQDLTGTWSYPYTVPNVPYPHWTCGMGSFTVSGTVTLVLSQSGSNVTGTVTMTNLPDFQFQFDQHGNIVSCSRASVTLSGPLSGTLSGNVFSAAISMGAAGNFSFLATVSVDELTDLVIAPK